MAKSKTPSKKTGTKALTKKKAVKKVAAKKKSATKKATSTRKPAARVAKKTIRRKAVETAITKQKTKKKENKSVVETIEASPPVVEKSLDVNTNTNGAVPGLDKKSMQQAVIRNYDNHHISLSNRKGGIKPSGKKPLW